MFPMSFQTAISLVAALDDHAFAVLRDQIRGPDGFETGSRRCAGLSAHMKVDQETVQVIVQTVGYMYDQIHGRTDGRVSVDEIRAIIDQDLDFEDGSDRERLYGRLEDLLTRDDAIDAYRRTRDLKLGFLARAVGFSSVVDLRPEPSGSGPVKLVPLVQFKVVTDVERDGANPILFQLDLRALADLEAEIREVRDRLNSLRQDPGLGPTLPD